MKYLIIIMCVLMLNLSLAATNCTEGDNKCVIEEMLMADQAKAQAIGEIQKQIIILKNKAQLYSMGGAFGIAGNLFSPSIILMNTSSKQEIFSKKNITIFGVSLLVGGVVAYQGYKYMVLTRDQVEVLQKELSVKEKELKNRQLILRDLLVDAE